MIFVGLFFLHSREEFNDVCIRIAWNTTLTPKTITAPLIKGDSWVAVCILLGYCTLRPTLWERAIPGEIRSEKTLKITRHQKTFQLTKMQFENHIFAAYVCVTINKNGIKVALGWRVKYRRKKPSAAESFPCIARYFTLSYFLFNAKWNLRNVSRCACFCVYFLSLGNAIYLNIS